uniref:hypothetical protein n=1 Tax=Okeania sp. SIO2F4 TaxID=2607790 RepID=UPI0025DF3DD2
MKTSKQEIKILPLLKNWVENLPLKPRGNSSETPVYSKSHELYALDLARDATQKRGYITVVE